jgi:hypothetical protein
MKLFEDVYFKALIQKKILIIKKNNETIEKIHKKGVFNTNEIF